MGAGGAVAQRVGQRQGLLHLQQGQPGLEQGKTVLPAGKSNVARLQLFAEASDNSAVVLSDSASFAFANDLAEVVVVNYAGATINVSAVPVSCRSPESWEMRMQGLASLGLLRRKS